METLMENELGPLIREILAFRDKRDWHQYHDPKSLSQAIGIEAAELQEIFLWMTTDQAYRLNDADKARVREELADIFIFMMYLCDTFDIDLLRAVALKLEKNALKYPIEKSKGLSTKYTDL
jgi:NTP pyrophosphatase (non-canonical NTP hydrolase)